MKCSEKNVVVLGLAGEHCLWKINTKMDRLPDELILEITDRLDDRSLATFAATSRRFYFIGLRELKKRGSPYIRAHIKFMITRPELYEFMSHRNSSTTDDYANFLRYEAFPIDYVKSVSLARPINEDSKLPVAAFSTARVFLVITITDNKFNANMHALMNYIGERAQKFTSTEYSRLFDSSNDEEGHSNKLIEHLHVRYRVSNCVGGYTFRLMRLHLDGRYTPAVIRWYDGTNLYDIFELLKSQHGFKRLLDAMISNADAFNSSIAANDFEYINVDRHPFYPICRAPRPIEITAKLSKPYDITYRIFDKSTKERLNSFSYWDRPVYRVQKDSFKIRRHRNPNKKYSCLYEGTVLSFMYGPENHMKLKLCL